MKNFSKKSQIRIPYCTLSETITNTLREKILSGELREGSQLKQEELATQFSVSMSALREALKRLEAEGLVKFYPNRGAIVSELSADEAKEIFEIRLFLELGALELAFPKLTKVDLAEADAILKEADKEGDVQRWGELNWRFHETIYRPAHRPRLLTLIRNAHNNVERYMRFYLSTMNYQTKSQAEHWELLKGCAAGDVEGARDILRKHMTGASDILARYLSKENSTGGEIVPVNPQSRFTPEPQP